MSFGSPSALRGSSVQGSRHERRGPISTGPCRVTGSVRRTWATARRASTRPATVRVPPISWVKPACCPRPWLALAASTSRSSALPGTTVSAAIHLALAKRLCEGCAQQGRRLGRAKRHPGQPDHRLLEQRTSTQSGVLSCCSGWSLETPGTCRPLSATWLPSSCGWVTQVRMS